MRPDDAVLAPIPAERRDDVRKALADAFGGAPAAGVSQVSGGVSALIYRVEVRGRDYLVRLERSRSPLRNPARGFASMTIAAEAGVAPAVLYANPESAIAIMDFVPARPLESFPGGAAALTRELGALVARLQRTTVFPALGDYPAMVERMLALVAGAGVFATGLLDPHAERAARIREVYPWNPAALVSSHNDPNPRNILYDGQRLWLIDWETAFRNDPLADIAILTIELASTPALEATLLEAWLGRAPDPGVRARLVLMQALTRLYYACLFFMTAAPAPGATPETDLTAPTVAEFRDAVAGGRLAPTSPQTLRILGKMQLAGFLAVACGPRFEDAMATVRLG
ncbi:MAG TPA: phosphotransferase [Caulobacteraceae bacterium]|jgi:aminoglycoside phosphotransferase (APT) family kinase protein|nr:phosphotransferase [Caulobacteraceae bacterium]